MNPEQIQPGQSYACRYNTLTGPRIALIVKQDRTNEKFLIRDVEDHTELVVKWDAVWDIDWVEWIDE